MIKFICVISLLNIGINAAHHDSCSLNDIEWAGTKKDDGDYNYPGGLCSYVKETDECSPGSNFNFLVMYYCGFEHFGSWGKYVMIIPCSVSIYYVFH